MAFGVTSVLSVSLARWRVLLGPNGSGKSTLFDVFAFVADCFGSGLRRAWDTRARARELKTRGSDGSVSVEIKYREMGYPVITDHQAIDERRGGPAVLEEWLQWRRGQRGKPFRFLDYCEGQGRAVTGELPDEQDRRVEVPLKSADLLAVNALGQFAEHPRVAALREFISGWYVSSLSADSARGQPEAGPQEWMTNTRDNLANVIQYLAEQHGDQLERIFGVLRSRVPRIERVLADTMPDGRLLLQIKDAPFRQPPDNAKSAPSMSLSPSSRYDWTWLPPPDPLPADPRSECLPRWRSGSLVCSDSRVGRARAAASVLHRRVVTSQETRMIVRTRGWVRGTLTTGAARHATLSVFDAFRPGG